MKRHAMQQVIERPTPQEFLGHRTIQAGFTFLELILSISILTVVSASVFLLCRQIQQRYVAEQNYSAAVQNARIALDVIGRRLRQAGNDPASAGFTPISYAGDTLTVRSDLTGTEASANELDSTGDPDSYLSAAFEQTTIRYDGAGKRILLDTGYGEETLAENIRKLEFKFYDGAGTETADMSQVSKIVITLEALTAAADPETREAVSLTLSESVYLRSGSYSPFG